MSAVEKKEELVSCLLDCEHSVACQTSGQIQGHAIVVWLADDDDDDKGENEFEDLTPTKQSLNWTIFLLFCRLVFFEFCMKKIYLMYIKN